MNPTVPSFTQFNFASSESTTRPPVLLLSGADLARLLSPRDDLLAARAAFNALTHASTPMPMHLPVPGGGFHAKAATYRQDGRDYVVLKLNGNFPANPATNGLPTIQGALLLCDAGNGALLAIMDSAEITRRRTAAASALAATMLARKGASRLAICGCGLQGRAHLEQFAAHFDLDSVTLFDQDSHAAESLAADAHKRFGLKAHACDLSAAVADRDIVVTVTPSTTPFLFPDMISPGTFIAAAGADHPEKSEIAPALMATARRVFDSVAQCAAMGDLHHALDAGMVDPAAPGDELVDVLTSRVPGRLADSDVILFDSTGLGMQDAASSVAALQRAQHTISPSRGPFS